MNDIQKYYEKYNNIENKIIEQNIENEHEILTNLKDDLDNINLHKDLVTKSKSLMIKINKSKKYINYKKNIEKYINKSINKLDCDNTNELDYIINNYRPQLNINYQKLNYKLELLINNTNNFKFLDFYSIINQNKEKKNNLHKLISSINFKKYHHNEPKIIFLDSFNNLDNYDNISNFISKFNFKNSKKSTKILKRGFLFEISDNQKLYILKYQPNKSFIEILINKYLSKYNNLKQYILYPNYFFVNKNNSYFYIIEKYDIDLYTYIKKKKDPFDDNELMYIIKFLSKIIYLIHDIGIIYADIKLENIIVNIENNKINDIKLIDFDVSLFDNLPTEFSDFEFKIQKLLKNKKPRGTKLYMSDNKIMDKSNDVYSFGTLVIILLYKNIIKILHSNKEKISDNLLFKILNRLTYYKNKLDDNQYKKKLIKYIYRIYNDKRFKSYWNNKISMKIIYNNIKKCIDQDITFNELYTNLN